MRRWITLVGLAFAVACSADSSTTPVTSGAEGIYQLQTVGGQKLPFGTTSGATRTEVLSDQLSLNRDGTFSEITAFRYTTGGAVTTSQSGRLGYFDQANGLVTFTLTTNGSGTFSASVSGKTLTTTFGGGDPWVYQR